LRCGQEVVTVGTQKEVWAPAQLAGWRNADPDHLTAAFAIDTLRRWWEQMGRPSHPSAVNYLILIEVGCKNQRFTRPWQAGLQRWADETSLHLAVCYFPLGVSKWQKVEQRLFVQQDHHPQRSQTP